MTRQAACGGPLVGGGLLPAELTTRYDHVLEEHVELGCRHRSHRSRKCRRPARMPAIKKMIRNIPELCGTSGTCASRGHHDLQNAPRGAERGGVELGVGAVAMVVGQNPEVVVPLESGSHPDGPRLVIVDRGRRRGSKNLRAIAKIVARRVRWSGFGRTHARPTPCCQSGLRSVEFQDGSRIVTEYSGSKFLRTVPSTS